MQYDTVETDIPGQ